MTEMTEATLVSILAGAEALKAVSVVTNSKIHPNLNMLCRNSWKVVSSGRNKRLYFNNRLKSNQGTRLASSNLFTSIHH